MKLLGALLVVIQLIFSQTIQAQSKSYTKDRCESSGNEFASSMNARDFDSYKNIALWTIKNCQPYLDQDEYMNLYGNLALADNALGNFGAALKNANYCISQKYSIADCHLEKANALRNLNKTTEFLKEKKIALSVLNDAKNAVERNLVDQNISTSKRSLYKSQIYKYDSMIDFLNKLD